MRKISFVALFAALVMNVNATDLFTGTKQVTWSTPLHIEAAMFANAQPGQKIVLTYTDAKEMAGEENKGSVVEFKVMNANYDHMAGTREALRLWDNNTLEHFLTVSAVDSLKAHGLEITGNDFTVTKVTLEDGKVLKEGFTVWTGFFWANEWSTLELYYNGYVGVEWSKATALRIYSEAKSTDYFLKIMNTWEADGLIADNNQFVKTNEYAELVLTDDLRTKLAAAGHWMVQFNKETGEAFNVTDIVLVMDKGESQALEHTAVEAKTVKTIENGQVVIIKNGVRYNALGAKL
ncbi:MAG: hypothetical protein IJ249_06075 [Paludibacteraceae bacterium]|nr:hypothetical protein [Paludibacteraceae bacterium]